MRRLVIYAAAPSNMDYTTRLTNWTVGNATTADGSPDIFVDAAVPGAVQLDWARANGWKPYSWDCEAERYKGLEDAFWHYQTAIPPLNSEKHHRLVFRGIDHEAVVWLDGTCLGSGVGTAGNLVFDIGPSDSERSLRVVIKPAPKVPETHGRDRARETTKAAVAYTWDFHPDLVPLGLCGSVEIESVEPTHLRNVVWRDRVEGTGECVCFSATVAIVGSGTVSARLLDPDEVEVWSETASDVNGEVAFCGKLDAPRLWWPRGHGAPERYTLEVSIGAGAGQVFRRKVGFKRSRLIMAPGQWEEPSAFPKSRSLPPMTLEINGRVVFGKGANFVGPDIFPGQVSDADWRRFVERAVEANMNTLRIWGGSRAPEDAFFEACDEAGIMVIQEFPLACNDYPDKTEYLAELDLAARHLIDRLAGRPCRILWSGGNELFNAWSGMTDQSHALRLLASLAWQLDPDVPFLPTLPVEGIGHGYYLFRDPATGVEVLELFQRASNTAYTEFGVPGAADVARIAEIVPAEEMWPPRNGGAWKLHAGMEAWDVEPTSYLCLSTIEHYWGPQRDLESLVAKSQWLQVEGHKAIIEEGRRQRPVCNWTLLWCLNEPWPTVANQCLVAYGDRPKPALKAVAQAMRTTLASARIPRFAWSGGDLFEADLWILHDGPDPRPGMRVEAILSCGGWQKSVLTWVAEAGEPLEDFQGPRIRIALPHDIDGVLQLELRTSDELYSSQYRLVARRAELDEGTQEDGPRGLNA